MLTEPTTRMGKPAQIFSWNDFIPLVGVFAAHSKVADIEFRSHAYVMADFSLLRNLYQLINNNANGQRFIKTHNFFSGRIGPMAHHVDEIIQELINKVEQIELSPEKWHKYARRNYAERMEFLITIRSGAAEAQNQITRRKKIQLSILIMKRRLIHKSTISSRRARKSFVASVVIFIGPYAREHVVLGTQCESHENQTTSAQKYCLPCDLLRFYDVRPWIGWCGGCIRNHHGKW